MEDTEFMCPRVLLDQTNPTSKIVETNIGWYKKVPREMAKRLPHVEDNKVG